MQKSSNNLIQKSRLNMSLNRIGKCCSNPVNRSTKNVLDGVDITRRIYCVCRATWLMTTYTVRKSIKLYAIYVTFGNILCLEFEMIVFPFKVI